RGRVGEIWVKGASVAQGYWERSKESQSTFHAQTADGRGPYLRTGDLGFMDKEQLYISGRLKDLIIVRGVNYYPQDLERCAEEACTDLRPGCSAAFSLDVGQEERL